MRGHSQVLSFTRGFIIFRDEVFPERCPVPCVGCESVAWHHGAIDTVQTWGDTMRCPRWEYDHNVFVITRDGGIVMECVSAGQEQGVFVTSMVTRSSVTLRCQGPVPADDDHTGVSGQWQGGTHSGTLPRPQDLLRGQLHSSSIIVSCYSPRYTDHVCSGTDQSAWYSSSCRCSRRWDQPRSIDTTWCDSHSDTAHYCTETDFQERCTPSQACS